MFVPWLKKAVGALVRMGLQLLLAFLLIVACYGVLALAALAYEVAIAPLPEWGRMLAVLVLLGLLLYLEQRDRTAPRYPRTRD